MPRKYKPNLVYFDQWTEFPDVEMIESKYGEWVKLETYEHVYAQLSEANKRQQKEIQRLKDIIYELTIKQS